MNRGPSAAALAAALKQALWQPLPHMHMQRVCKLLSAAGVCSRREAELLIQQRRLSLRDAVVEHPAVKLAAADLQYLAIDGARVDDILGGAGFAQAAALQLPRLWRLHKPAGTIVSSAGGDSDTVFQLDR